MSECTFAQIREAPVPITLINDTLASAAVDQHRIVGLALVSGAEATCSAFVDASYEGDLLAAAGVTYTWGREGNATYNESFAGGYAPLCHVRLG